MSSARGIKALKKNGEPYAISTVQRMVRKLSRDAGYKGRIRWTIERE